MGTTSQMFYCKACNNLIEFECDYSNIGSVNVITSDIDAEFNITPELICPNCGKITDKVIDINTVSILQKLINKNYIISDYVITHNLPRIYFKSKHKIPRKILQIARTKYRLGFTLVFHSVDKIDKVNKYNYYIEPLASYIICNDKKCICDGIDAFIDLYFKRM